MNGRARGDRAIKTVLAVLVLLGLASLALPFLLTPPASLLVSVVDTVFASDLAGATATFVDLDTDKRLRVPVAVSGDGFVATVPRIESGSSRFALEIEGYQPQTLEIEAAPLATARVAAPLVPLFGQLAVSVVNARSAEQPVGGLLVHAGDRQAEGDGRVVFPRLPPGGYTVRAEAADYCPGDRKTAVRAGETTELLLPLPPRLIRGENARLILDWADNPSDLDAHVLLSGSTVPLANNHIYYRHKVGEIDGGGRYAELDVDWLRSEGFETITVYDRADGVYQYFVHHYGGTGSLGASAAEVQVFTDGCARQRYQVPEACDQRWWYVADLKIAGGEVSVVERNVCQDRQPFSWDRRRKPEPAAG